MHYLPDVDIENPRMMQRDFLINIMATCDNDFFDKAVNEAKANRLKNSETVIQDIEIDPKLAEALDGFLMQETRFPFEVIVRDDSSPDKTADII